MFNACSFFSTKGSKMLCKAKQAKEHNDLGFRTRVNPIMTRGVTLYQFAVLSILKTV